jgi:hypothetical protein
MQVFFQGKTSASLPAMSLRCGAKFAGWHWTQSENHWSNIAIQKQLTNLIISPYCQRKKQELGLPQSQKSLWLIDCWRVHISEEYRKWVKEHHPDILVLFIPPNCTSRLQPQDVAVQKPLKAGFKTAFVQYQIEQFEKGLRNPGTDFRF